MELKEYWRVIQRRWRLAIIPTLLLLAIGLFTYTPPQPSYEVELQFIISQNLLPDTEENEEARYFHWITSEYVVYSVTDWVNGTDFAERVRLELLANNIQLGGNEIVSAITSEAIRSRMTISVVLNDEAETRALAEAIVKVLQEENSEAAPQLSEGTARLQEIDDLIVTETSPGILAQLGLVLRIGVALAAGIVAMLLAEYFDPFIHSQHDLSGLKLSILGEIPKV